MTPRTINGLLALIICISLSACSGFKETKVGHFFDNVGARYNGYFHAKEKVLATRQAIEQSHIEDFNKILDVLRLGDEKTGKLHAAEMDEASKKCVRVIQRHKGSDWVDKSYFVIAQSYFFKADYYTALDLFKFLSSEYPDTDLGKEAVLWTALCYLQIENFDNAQAYIVNILNDKELSESLERDAHLINAHVKIKTLNYSDAIKSLEKAIPNVKNRKERNRYIFILAQLYQETGNKRKAIAQYSRIENRNMPYEFLFQTRINISKCTDLRRKESAEKVIKSFQKLLKDDNNIDYFDQIYYEIGQVYVQLKDEKLALENFKKSAYYSKDNLNQKANTYLVLGDIYFTKKQYVIAGAYFDSCANVIPTNHEKFDEIKTQQSVLSELIENLNTIKVQDSLLYWASVPQKDLNAQIAKVKKLEALAEEEAKKKAEIQKRKEEIEKSKGEGSLDPSLMRGTGSGEWTLYNPTAIGTGHTRFVKKWGNRPNEDDWRRSKKVNNSFQEFDEGDSSSFQEPEPIVKDSTVTLPYDIENLDKEDISYYQELPFLPNQKKAAEAKVIEALYGNGVLYYEKLANYPLSLEAFNTLMNRYPDNKFELETKYYLYKLYDATGDTTKALAMREHILNDYPDSEYAKLLSGNGNFSSDYEVNTELEDYYKTVYSHFLNKKCGDVVELSSKADTLFTDNYLKPNFEFLKTVCVGKDKPNSEFIPSLQLLITTFPNHAIAKDAANIIRYLNKQVELEEQAKKDSIKHFQDSVKKHVTVTELDKMLDIPYKYTEEGAFIYVVVYDLKDAKANAVQNAFSDFNRKYHRSKDLIVQSNYWKEKDKMVVYVMGLKDMRMAIAFHKGLISDQEFLEEHHLDEASLAFAGRDNFKLLIKAQSEVEYMQFFDANYSTVIQEFK